MHRWFRYCLLLLCSSLLLVGQTTKREKPASDTSNQQKDIDPLALKVLKAVTKEATGDLGELLKAIVAVNHDHGRKLDELLAIARR